MLLLLRGPPEDAELVAFRTIQWHDETNREACCGSHIHDGHWVQPHWHLENDCVVAKWRGIALGWALCVRVSTPCRRPKQPSRQRRHRRQSTATAPPGRRIPGRTPTPSAQAPRKTANLKESVGRRDPPRNSENWGCRDRTRSRIARRPRARRRLFPDGATGRHGSRPKTDSRQRCVHGR